MVKKLNVQILLSTLVIVFSPLFIKLLPGVLSVLDPSVGPGDSPVKKIQEVPTSWALHSS